MFCKQCGANNSDEARFCTQCGQSLTDDNMFSETALNSMVVGTNVIKKNIIGIVAGSLLFIATFLPYTSVSFFGVSMGGKYYCRG